MEDRTKPENKIIKMSIQVRLNGLSFCTLNLNTNEILWYHSINFQKEYNPVKILQQIDALYTSEKQLQIPVQEVVLLFSHDLYSFVPREYFKEEEASHYLKFNTKILKTDVVAHDVLEKESLINVYIPYTNITNYFFEKYGEFEYHHSISILAEEVVAMDAGENVKMYLNNFKGYYDLVVVQNNKLLLCNTFNYETKEDFIYYLLFTAEQLKLKVEEVELILLGDIYKESPYYEIAYLYIKNVDFLQPNFQITQTEYQTQKFQREAFIHLKTLK